MTGLNIRTLELPHAICCLGRTAGRRWKLNNLKKKAASLSTSILHNYDVTVVRLARKYQQCDRSKYTRYAFPSWYFILFDKFLSFYF